MSTSNKLTFISGELQSNTVGLIFEDTKGVNIIGGTVQPVEPANVTDDSDSTIELEA